MQCLSWTLQSFAEGLLLALGCCYASNAKEARLICKCVQIYRKGNARVCRQVYLSRFETASSRSIATISGRQQQYYSQMLFLFQKKVPAPHWNDLKSQGSIHKRPSKPCHGNACFCVLALGTTSTPLILSKAMGHAQKHFSERKIHLHIAQWFAMRLEKISCSALNQLLQGCAFVKQYIL